MSGGALNVDEARTTGEGQDAPTLVAYYEGSSVRPAAWVKAVRAARLDRFAEDDREAATRLLCDGEHDARRTLWLAQTSRLPAVVSGWLGRAVPELLKARLVDVTTPDPDVSAATWLGRAAAALSPALRDKRKWPRNQAEALLKLALWHAQHSREMSPGDGLAALSRALVTGGERELQLAQRLRGGRLGEIRDLALGYAVAASEIEASAARHRDALRLKAATEEKLAAAEATVRNLRGEIEAQRMQALETAKAQRAEKEQLEARALSLAHELEALKDRLRGRIADPMLPEVADAIDALLMTPPYLEAARERLERLKELLEGEKAWLSSGASG